MEKKIVDAMGKQCPIPVVEAKKAIGQLNGEGIVEVHVDNEVAKENLLKLAASEGASAEFAQEKEGHFIVTIAVEGRGQDGEKNSAAPTADCGCGPMFGTVYVFDSDTMGSGSDELGRTLIKGFIYAVSQLPQPPECCIFYNSGAKLTAEGSASLEDLRELEERGTEILTCGTCANFFDLGEKIQVGSVTNMYTIVEKLDGAGKIVKP